MKMASTCLGNPYTLLEALLTYLPDTDEKLREQNNVPHSAWVAKQGQHVFKGHMVPVPDNAGAITGGVWCGFWEMQLIHDNAAIVRHGADPLQARVVEDGKDHSLYHRHITIIDKKYFLKTL